MGMSGETAAQEEEQGKTFDIGKKLSGSLGCDG